MKNIIGKTIKLALVALGITAFAADAWAVNVSYVDVDGTTKQVDATVVAASASRVTWNAGWYVVNSEVTLSKGAKCSGDVKLILADGAKLTINNVGDNNAGIGVSGDGNSLAIYGQTAGTGALDVTGGDCGAGIGGGADAGSNITINGGTVTANGGDCSAGIGGGDCSPGLNITINGGTVTATGGSDGDYCGAGIGGGDSGDGFNITINGGTVTATGGSDSYSYGGAAGIGGGGGGGCAGSDITINGGIVTATGGSGEDGSGDGIGSGYNGNEPGDIFVADNILLKADNNNPPTTVIAHASATTDVSGKLFGQRYATAVDLRVEVEYIDENGATKTTNAIPVAASDTRVTWTAGWYVVTNDVTVKGGADCSGAVNLILADAGKLTISGVVMSQAGIGVTGDNSLAIYGQTAGTGALTVTGGSDGAGIGGGSSAAGSDITINGGTVTATGGGTASAGIGGGYKGSGSNITINGGTVTATGTMYGSGIGGAFGGGASNIFVADNVVLKADGNNPPTTVIAHASATTDISSSLNGQRYATAAVPCTDCITFSSAAAFTLKTTNSSKLWDGTLWTSTDQLNWTEWNGGEVSAAQAGGTGAYNLYVRGNTANTKITDWRYSYGFALSGSGKIACTGNIETLRGATGNNPSPTPMASTCYMSLFSGCKVLTSAPALPATTLAESCYASMFYGCTSLTSAPALPATTLAESCYAGMFNYCTSLTNAPALPATTLELCCYQEMFRYCTSLTTAPALPATTLADYCYNLMFYCCKVLTTAPALPATTLEDCCYQEMFRSCTSLEVNTAAPGKEWKIPVEETEVDCWGEDMFYETAGTLTGQPDLNTTYYVASAPATVAPQAVANTTSYKVYTNDTVLVSENASGMVRWGAAVKVTYTAAEGYEFPGGAATWTTNVTANAETVAVTIPASEQPVVSMVSFTVADVPNTTNAVEGATLVEGTTYKAVPGAAVTVTYTADFGYFFADGAKTSVVETTAEKGATITTETERVVAAAKIGTDKDFFTFEAAFDAAQDGDTVTLLANAELGATISVTNQVALDIGAYNVTPKAAFAGNALFALQYGADFTVLGTTGTVDASPLSTVLAAIKLPTDSKTVDAAKRAKLTVNANLTGNYYAIVGNGKCGYTDIVVNGGTITAAVEGNNQAIFNPQGNSTVTVNGGTLTGHNSAVEMRGGTLTVNGGTLASTATSYSVVKNKSGSTTVGAAVAVAQYASAGDLSVDVTGGTITGFKSVSVANPQSNKTENVTVTLGAATYEGALAFSADGNATVINDGAQIAAPEGYAWDKDGKLAKAAAKIGMTDYVTLKDAFDALKDGDTVTLTADSEGVDTLTCTEANVTLDLNGFTYGHLASASGNVLSAEGGKLTITDSSADADGKLVKYGAATVVLVKNGAELVVEKGQIVFDGDNEVSQSAGYVLSVRANSSCTMNGGKVIVKKKYNEAALRSDGTIVVNGGYVDGGFKVNNPGTITLKGGTYTEDPTAYVAAGYASYKDGDVWKIGEAAAKIGTTYYLTLQDAFDAVKDGETVTLVADIADGQATLANAVAITLDLAGKTMNCTTPKDPNNWYGYTLRVSVGQLTIDDTVGGGQILNANDDSALRCCAPSGQAGTPKLIVKAGTFENNSEESGTVYSGPTTGAQIEILGGSFENTFEPFAYGGASAVLNVGNGMANTNTAIVVKGGTFSVDPSLGDDAQKSSYVAANYYSVADEGLFTVQDATGLAACIGSKGYKTLADAADDAQDGDTVKLLADATADGITVDVDATLDLNGKTLTVANGQTFTANGAVAISNGVAGQGGLAIDGTAAISGGLDISTLTYGVGGLLANYDGTLSVGATGTAKLLNTWAAMGLTPNWLAANRAGFLTAADGGKVQMGATVYTAKDGLFGTADTVAKATITVGTLTYTETFDSLATAIGKANDDTSVTLLANVTTDAEAAFAINKNLTLDFATYTVEKTVANHYTFDIANGATVVFTGSTGGVKQTQTAKNLEYPASMIRNKGNLTIEGGVYESDFCIIKNDEGPGAGVLTVNGGTFNVAEAAEGFADKQWALMNWATATVNGGEWNGTIGTRSCDRNAVSKAGATEITAELDGEVDYLLYVGYEGDTTWANMPKIKGVDIEDVELEKNAAVTADLYLVEKDGWITASDSVAAKIGTTYYVTLQDAFDAVKDGETITLVKDVADAQAKFNNAVAATLDLNGKTFCCATPKDPNNWYGFTMRVYKGTLTIEDSVGGGKVVNSNDDSALRCCAAGDDFASEPKVIVLGGTFENSSKSESTVYAGAGTAQHGTIVISNAAVTVQNAYDGAFDFGNASRILNVGNGNPAGSAAITVYAGTYQVDPELGDDKLGGSYVAPGYASYKDGDMFTVLSTDEAEAKIGTKYYLTLKEAFDAVEAGQEIELLADAELDATISVGKKMTLDIGAYNVTPKATFAGNALFALMYGADFTVLGTTGTVDASSLSTVYAAIKMPTSGTGSDTNRAKLTVNANLTGNYYAIVGNGKYGYTDITVNGGTITAAVEGNNQAIFNPQGNSTVTINGGMLTGHNSAIEIRGGTLTVNGGTLTSTATTYSVVKNKSGSTTVGAAIAVAQYASAGALTVDVAGGTITGFKSVSVANPQSNKTENVSVTLGTADYTGDLAFSADGNATVINDGSGLAAPAGYGWDKDGKLSKCEDIEIGGGLVAKDFGDGQISIEGEGELADISALAGTAITNLTIGAGVTGIADNLFATRRDLRDVTIGADCATVGASSFGKCRNVTNIVVKGDVTVGDYAFLRCNSLQTITFEGLAEFNKTPFALHTGIYMKDGMPQIYAVPEVKINGYKQVLMGTNDLADPESWTAITDEAEKANYHFFKIEMVEE